MQHSFPLFQTPLDLAHNYWKKLLQPGDWAIDATCGNGKDTLILSGCAEGVIALDVQKIAIERAKITCQGKKNVHFFCSSHETFPELAKEKPIRLIVYNLGYLPGSDKRVRTHVETTLRSLRQGLELLLPGGVISVTAYPGHAEGEEEEVVLLQELASLSPGSYSVCHHRFLNRPTSPSLFLIQKSNNF